MGLATNENKVLYGLENITWWPLTKDERDTAPTYGAAKKWPGAVNFTAAPSGDSDPFYADNSIYFMPGTNSGYDITFENAKVPEEVEEYALGQFKDKNGNLVEGDNSILKPFAIAGELTGDKKARRVIFYKCFMKRPETGAETKGSNNSPKTASASIVAVPLTYVAAKDVDAETGEETEFHPIKNATTASTTKASYDAWFTEPQLPEFAEG